MKKKIAVLGAGLVGYAIARDLSFDHDVTAADIDKEQLEKLSANFNIKTKAIDLSIPENIKDVIQDCDLVIGAVPGFMGFESVKSVIGAGKDIVDISFFPEDAFELDSFAKEKNVTAIVDCGVAPGLSNLILGYHYKRMDVTNFECFVGGLPKKRTYPYQYKAPFSPADVLEEYTRPAKFLEDDMIILQDPLSWTEIVDFEEIGSLEAFISDGLRSLVKTMKIPNMVEKTLRYPGHIEKIKLLRDSGFFSTNPVDIGGQKISPRDFTSKILFPLWKLEKNEEEFTIIRINIAGREYGRAVLYQYELFDKYDPATEISSMARTTGYTATAAANLVLEGKYDKKGIIPPEFIGEDEESIKYITDYLDSRNVKIKRQILDR